METPPTDPFSRNAPDGFDLLEKIGAGATGEVWRALQRVTGRHVAVKILSPALAGSSSEKLAWRFQREIEAAAQQDHANIARVLTSGVAQGRPWYAMELVEGPPLDEFATRENRGIRERLTLFLSVCDGVQHAHDTGIIHRDLKPANILVGIDGQPKILDFGLARFLDDSGLGCTLSLSGQPLGTPMFMAPEQAAGKMGEVGVAADVYALGVILYRLATDAWPFDENLPQLQLITVVRDNEPRAPRSVCPGLARDLEAIILKAIAKAKTERYESVRQLSGDVKRFLDGETVTARKRTPGYVIRRRLRKHWRGFAVGALIVALIAGFSLASLDQRRRAAARNVRALTEARELVNVMLFDLRGKLEAIDRPDLFANIAAQAAKLPWPADTETTAELDLHRSRALAATSHGEALLAKGDAPKASERYREAVAHLSALTAQHPGEPRYELDEISARLTLHATLAQAGHHREAVRGARAILARLEKPRSPEWSEPVARLRAETHRVVGTAFQKGQHFEEARDEWQQALALFSQPPIADPQMQAALRRNLGEVCQKCARPAEALAFFQQAEAHDRRAHMEAPQNGGVSLDLSRCLSGKAAAHLDLQELTATRLCLDEARNLCGPLDDEVSPGETAQRRRVAAGYAALAKAHAATGDKAAALASDQEAMLLWRFIIRHDAVQVSDRMAIFEIRSHMADLQLQQGLAADAAESLRAALDQSRRLARERVDDARWHLTIVELELRLLDLPHPTPQQPREKRVGIIVGHLWQFDALTAKAKAPHAAKAEQLRALLAEETAKLAPPSAP